jgi:hypothetical protein
MSNNLIQFASIFDAAGAKINFDSYKVAVEIVEYPKGMKAMMMDAVDEIDRFLDTKTYNDGLAIFAIADFIDDEANQIHDDASCYTGKHRAHEG